LLIQQVRRHRHQARGNEFVLSPKGHAWRSFTEPQGPVRCSRVPLSSASPILFFRRLNSRCQRIIYNENARTALEKSIDILAEAVAVTLGTQRAATGARKEIGAPRSSMTASRSPRRSNSRNHIEKHPAWPLIPFSPLPKQPTPPVMAPPPHRPGPCHVKRSAQTGRRAPTPSPSNKGHRQASDFLVKKIEEHSQADLRSNAIRQVAPISAATTKKSPMTPMRWDKWVKEG